MTIARAVRCIAVLLSAACAFPAAGAQTALLFPAPPLPNAARAKNVDDAISMVRGLYMIQDYHNGLDVAEKLVKRFPSTHLRFWYVAMLTTNGRARAADSLTAKTDTLSRDPWLLAARSLAKTHALPAWRSNFAQAKRLARRARSLAPRDPDLAWLVAYATISTPGFPMTAFDEEIAYIDSVGPAVGNSPLLRVQLAEALYAAATVSITAMMSGMPQLPDTAKRNRSAREYEAAWQADPSNFRAFYSAGIRLSQTKEDSALSLMKRAIALSPRSVLSRQQYWTVINRQRTLSAAQKKDLIAADRADFLTLTDSAPYALEAAVTMMRGQNPDPAANFLEDRILAKAPHSVWAENVLLRRASQWNDSLYAARDTTRAGPKSDSTVMRKRYIDAMEAFIEKPWIANPSTRGQAITSLFFSVKDDSTYPTDHLVRLTKELIAAPVDMAPSARNGWSSRALSNRKVEMPLAEQLARDGLKQTAKYMDDFPAYFYTSVGDKADALDRSEATMHDEIGWVLYNKGNYADADKEIGRALELNAKSVDIYRDLGRLRVAQGRDEDAELAFAQGMTLRFRGVNPNQKELETIYKKNHVSMDGWTAYLGALVEKERATRKARILATRDTAPKTPPPFKLADLTGAITSSDTLSRRSTVVNFWGTWCGPCVAEMPELQQFYDKYKNDKSIAILTISNDKDLVDLKEWMKTHKITVPTLFDDGYVANSAAIHAFPTTWFISPDGKTQFTAIGNGGALVEEWSWRLEATREKPVPVTIKP